VSLRDKLNYETDGIVIKIDRLQDQDTLGVVGKRPRYAIAWKFPPLIKTTILKDVLFQVGRTGVVTPVGILEPVNIGGAMVTRVTLHNKSEIERKDIRIGDEVEVIRSGDVIPKILQPLVGKRKGKGKKVSFPKTCPVCETKLIYQSSDILVKCPNTQCMAQLKNSIIHFVSKDALDIDGLGKELVFQLIDKRIIKNIVDIFRLDATKLNQLERAGEKMITNLLASIESSKNSSMHRFIYGLGIPGVGSKTAKNLGIKFQTIDKLFQVSIEELREMSDIGDIASENIFQFFKNNHQLVEDLLNQGIKIPPPGNIHQGPLSGKKILFTGTLSLPRRIAKEKAEKAGGEIVSSLSKNTDFLITGQSPGSKLKKANDLGIAVLTEIEFLNYIHE